MPDLVGYLAGTLISVSLLPQLVKSWRSRRVKDISLKFLILYVLGIGLLIVYGILIVSWPIILMNIVALFMAGSMLYLKIKHG